MNEMKFYVRPSLSPLADWCGAVVPFLCLFILTAALPAPAQQRPKPNIANEVEEKKSEPPAPPTRPPSEPRPPATTRRRSSAPSRVAAAPAVLNVTFVTDAADTDLFLHLNDVRVQKLGRTGADGKLLTRLARGVYEVTASRAGQPQQRRQIDVRPGKTMFTFNLRGAIGSPVAAPTLTAEEVFKRFLNPQQSDDVTLNDWLVAQAETDVVAAQNPYDPQFLAQALFAQGQVAYLRGDQGTALAAFNNSALRMPASALAYYGLGNAYRATGQPGEAERAYGRAIELNPNLAMAYKGMGDVLFTRGKTKEALDYYQRASALGYTSTAVRFGVARSLLKQRRWQQSLMLLNDLAKVQPTTEVFIGIGDSYMGLKQPANAAPAYRQAMQRDPRSALAHFKYGETSYGLREYAPAMDALERALVLDPAGTTINRERAREMANKAAEKLGKKN